MSALQTITALAEKIDRLESQNANLTQQRNELLDALMDCERNMIISTNADMNRLDRIRAAIAKATGQ